MARSQQMLCAVVYLTHLLITTGYAQEPGSRWVKVGEGIADSALVHVVTGTYNPDSVIISSKKALYFSDDRGHNWTELFSLRTTEKVITSIAYAETSETLYVGTTDGMYRGGVRAENWQKISSGLSRHENVILALMSDKHKPERLIAGTMSGIYLTEDNGRRWLKGSNIPSRCVITALAPDHYDPALFYAASSCGLHKSVDSGMSWDRIYPLTTPEENYQHLLDDEEQDISAIRSLIKARDVLTDPDDSRKIYFATAKGLLISADAGETWNRAGGLLTRTISKITTSGSTELYGATDKGVFAYIEENDSWLSMHEGLYTDDIRSLNVNNRGVPPVLWAATGKGLFKYEMQQGRSAGKDGHGDVKRVLSMFSHEPTVQEIRKAAIMYAEVQPEKINKWRKAAARKAWLPDLRVAYDDARDWQSSTYFYKNTYEEQYLKDDDITRGNDKGWSVSLTWELGDLIWNSAQTSIDVRSRLMVQLRDDILNEVTRLYFERRRLQIEMVTAKARDFSQGIERELKIQELTAAIDSLTGSYLSKRLGR